MSQRNIGWSLVLVQVVLLLTLILLPGRDDWTISETVRLVANIFFYGGLVIIAVAFFGLGTALTATPVPKDGSSLKTGGLYRLVRHPIYTGVLAVVIGMTLGSGSYITLAVGLTTIVFFNLKARWEELQLVDRFGPEYSDYMSRTPRFVPRLVN